MGPNENRTKCNCFDNYYRSNDICVSCPTGGICTQSNEIKPENGYWQLYANSEKLVSLLFQYFSEKFQYKCFSDDACDYSKEINPATGCPVGYQGKLCAICQGIYFRKYFRNFPSDAYHSSGVGNCEKCQTVSKKDTYIFGSLIAAACILFIAKLYIEVLKDNGRDVIKVLRKRLSSLFTKEELASSKPAIEMKDLDTPSEEKEQRLETANKIEETIEEIEEEFEIPEFTPDGDHVEMVQNALLSLGNFKVTVGFLQVFSNYTQNFEIPWCVFYIFFTLSKIFVRPESFQTMVSYFSFINVDYFNIISAECYKKTSFYDRLVVITILPLVIMGLVAPILYGLLCICWK